MRIALALAILSVVLAGCTSQPQREVGPLVGNLAPPVEVTPVDAQPWSLAAQRGKVVLLDLMGVNCAPCREEMPHLVALARAHANDTGFAMLSIDMASVYPGLGARNVEEIRGFRDEFGATWPFAPDAAGVGRAYQPIALPTLVVVDPQGIIHRKFSGGLATEAQLEGAIAAARGT